MKLPALAEASGVKKGTLSRFLRTNTLSDASRQKLEGVVCASSDTI